MSQRTWILSGFGPRPGSLFSMVSLLYLWHLPVVPADTVQVYRCRGDDGVVEFRQQYCDQGRQEEVRVDTTPSGWIPPRPTRENGREKRLANTRSASVRRDERRAAEREQKQEKECWRTRKRLDKLQWRMRRGYKAGKGPALRRQRRDYEEYLRKFC